MSNDQTLGNTNAKPAQTSWRIRFGTSMFYVPFAMFFGAPVVIPALGLSAGQTATLIGVILVVAEVIWFASIPLLGKEGFKAMKSKALGFLKLKEGPIGRVRHKAGVTLLVSSFVIEFLLTLSMMIGHFKVGSEDPSARILGLTFQEQSRVYITIEIATMVGIVISVYMLGADFAERMKKVFDYPY
jgi:hypothetical protein